MANDRMPHGRNVTWERIGGSWDIIIVGGGITGAGLLREAAHVGLRALLVERRDFAWGASSRSSKLVHGGLRYLKQGDLRLTAESVRARNRLLRAAAGLVTPLGFLLPVYRGERLGRSTYSLGLAMYDALGRQWSHRYAAAADFSLLAPSLAQTGLRGGFSYQDAQTDDARLVLRLLREAEAAGGYAINYVAAESLLHDEHGGVIGVRLRDTETDRTAEARAQVVVNATGAWADHLRGQAGGAMRLRPLRGSHLVFPAWRFPVAQAISFLHPADRRPVFALPWEGVTLVGTTDVDHTRSMDDEPAISPEEVAYLMAALDARFPALALTAGDAIASFAGLRPVISTGKEDPSSESRDAALWDDDGLLTVTGGKLTTFRESALMALQAIRQRVPGILAPAPNAVPLDAVAPLNAAPGTPVSRLTRQQLQRLSGRYGRDAAALVALAQPGELSPILETQTLWAELRWAARMEQVQHLDDLLLRRVRLGLLLPEGGAAHLDAIRAICQPELGWDDARWQAEEARYLALWRMSYQVPEEALRALRPRPEAAVAEASSRRPRWLLVAALVAASVAAVALVGILVARRAHHQNIETSEVSITG